jgi:hypothetical protein
VSGGLSPLASPVAYNFPKHLAQSQAAGGFPPPTDLEEFPLFASRKTTLLKLRLQQQEASFLSRPKRKWEFLAY